MKLILKYFPEITSLQIRQFNLLPGLYNDWNSKINVISRKDIDYLEERHILHALSIAKIFKPLKGTTFIDVGTGGGFPGIPLAIMFPDSNFHLVDSIGKKILVVQDIIDKLGLTNVKAEKLRVEELNTKYDFIISRAVTELPVFYKWTKNMINKNGHNNISNGIIYLKGGDIENEIKFLKSKTRIFDISDFFSEPFYQTKKIIHIFND
jgi:16S rRNA (guanine527-N7)-methyltransferase